MEFPAEPIQLSCLFKADILKRPKISQLLSRLASYEAVQAAPTHVDHEGKTALKRTQVVTRQYINPLISDIANVSQSRSRIKLN